MGIMYGLWVVIQVIIGYNLVYSFILLLMWLVSKQKLEVSKNKSIEPDYAIIVTAYEQTHTIPFVIKSILALNYQKFTVYVVADKCDVSDLKFEDPRIIILRPETTLGSNTKSHRYALDNFLRPHEIITIIDSDNLVDSEYLNELNMYFEQGFLAVQGIRKAKNLDTTLSCLDAARDIYYHFFDGKILFELGSSATLSGSGMAFTHQLYDEFLNQNNVQGAGFDKVLQAWLVLQDKRIAFAENAIVYDEKTSKSDQLVNQRSRWINTWFRYSRLGFTVIFQGVKNLSKNQLIFGTVLLRPPLFLFLLFAIISIATNLFLGLFFSIAVWSLAIAIFITLFFVALKRSQADIRIYKSLLNIPQFMFYQILSLARIRNANQRSVATKHSHDINDVSLGGDQK